MHWNRKQLYAAEENIYRSQNVYLQQVRVMQMRSAGDRSPFSRHWLELPDQVAEYGYQLAFPHQKQPNWHRRPRGGGHSSSLAGAPSNARAPRGCEPPLNGQQPSVDPGGWEQYPGQAYRDRPIVAKSARRRRSDAAAGSPPLGTRGYAGSQEYLNSQAQVHHRPQPQPYGLVYRKMYVEPGLYFRVPYGMFSEELIGQVADPQRLEPSRLVDCMLQVYQILRPITEEQIALAETGDADKSHEFNVLTPSKAHLLGLSRRREHATGRRPQTSEHLGPNRRLYRLSLLSDPSREPGPAPGDNEDGH